MGSTRFPLLTAALLLSGVPSLSSATPVPRIEKKSEYSSVDEIKAWASTAFFGGYEMQAISLKGKRIIVIIGQPTSGLVTSEVFVFSGLPNEKLEYIVHRNRLVGMAGARKKEDSIELVVSDREGHERVFLVIPADGL